jgi:hypothetical protein
MKNISFLICVLLLLLLPGRALGQDRPHDEITELLDLEFYLPIEVNDWYQQHRQDLTAPARRWVLASVHADPRKDATVIGKLTVEARWSDTKPLKLVLGYRPSQQDTTIIWREHIGDWGYGIHQFVLQRRGRWARLPPGPFGTSAWLFTRSQPGKDGVNGRISSIEKRLVEIGSMQVLNVPAGDSTTIDRDVYFVTRVDNRNVEFRPEKPSDMPCGAANDRSGNMANQPGESALYRVPLQQMMTEDGEPRFDIAYRRGC